MKALSSKSLAVVIGLGAAGLWLTLDGCAPRVEPAGPAIAAPRIDGAVFVAGDGGRLPIKVWPANGQTRAVIIAVHGFNDYSNAFSGPAAWWSKRGITIYAYDQRGFGAAPKAGLWAGGETLARDLGDAVLAVRGRHPGVPLYLLGASMGGAVAMVALAQGRVSGVDGVILVAPAVWGEDTLNPGYRALLWIASHTMPANRMSGRGLGIRASDNVEMLRALSRDPLVIKETRIDVVYGLIKLMDRALGLSGEVGAPLLILYGAHDEIIPENATRRLLDRITAPYRLALYPEGWHMLLRDRQAEVVWRDVDAWIADPSGPLPSDHERDGVSALAGD